jgi:serine/threonine-protein kinase
MQDDAADAVIDELMHRWKVLRSQGQTLTPQELGVDAADVIAELARRIDVYETRETQTAAGRQTVEQSMPFEPGLLPEPGGLSSAGGVTMVGHLVEARFHARGGLGEVLVARQAELDRPVALKRIRPDQFHERARERFLREAAITARLQHPGIVPIHGLGEDDKGPFYTMPFIEGKTLQEAIQELHATDGLPLQSNRFSLELKNLLRRFITVCDTMAYAHDQGVVHRDLKPSNIMLGPYGETFVMDWGLAKRYEGEFIDAEGEPESPSPGSSPDDLTAVGAVLGTPQYMSPEQACGRPANRPSDLYSLGVILYAILTGKSPYHESPPTDPLKPIRDAALVPPRERDASVPRALEAICLKAMAARPEDRYTTARVLGEDLASWLADEPVSAYREGVSARLTRWARRHRASVQAAALAVVAVAILASTAAVVVDQARRKVEAARTRLAQALGAESTAKAEAQANLSVAAQAVDDYFTKVSENALLKRQDAPEVRDLRPLRKELLEVALDYYNRLATRRSTSPALRPEQAAAYSRVGHINEEIGSKEAALEAYRQAQAIRTDLVAQSPGDVNVERELAVDHFDIATMLADIGRAADSLAEFARSQAILEHLLRADPDHAVTISELSRVYNGMGIALRSLSRPEEALSAFEQARALLSRLAEARSATAEDQRRLAMAHTNIGLLESEIGRPDAAIAALEESRVIDQRLLDARPTASGVQHDLACCYNNLGLVYSGAGRPAESLAALARGREIFQRLVKTHPSVIAYRRDLATNHINSGSVQFATGHPALALAEFEQARTLLEALFASDRSDTETRCNLATTLFNIGDALRKTGKYAQALQSAEQACTLLSPIHDRAAFEDFVLASAHDLSADLLGKNPSPPSAADKARRDTHIGEAIAALKRAVAGGYRAFDPKALSSLQSRRDFQDMILDLAFPAWPFASERSP